MQSPGKLLLAERCLLWSWGAPITQKGSDRSCNSYNWCNDDDNGDDNNDESDDESDDDSVDESDVSTTSTGPGAESMGGRATEGKWGSAPMDLHLTT